MPFFFSVIVIGSPTGFVDFNRETLGKTILGDLSKKEKKQKHFGRDKIIRDFRHPDVFQIFPRIEDD